jgi:hypothetical protein
MAGRRVPNVAAKRGNVGLKDATASRLEDTASQFGFPNYLPAHAPGHMLPTAPQLGR